MVGDDPQAHIRLVALLVLGAGDLTHLVGDIHHRVHVKERFNILAHAGQTLQSRTHIDVLLLQLGVVALSIVVEL